MAFLAKINERLKDSDEKRRYFIALLVGLIFLKIFTGLVYTLFSFANYEARIDVPFSKELLILQATFFWPIYEEITYRLPLRFNINYIRISVVFVFTFYLFTFEINRLLSEVGPHFTSRVILFAIATLVCLIVLGQSEVIETLKKVWEKRFLSVLIISQACFACAHLNLFDFSLPGIGYLLPVIIFNYLLMGLFFAYSRMKLGIMMSIFFHILFNSSYLVYTYFF